MKFEQAINPTTPKSSRLPPPRISSMLKKFDFQRLRRALGRKRRKGRQRPRLLLTFPIELIEAISVFVLEPTDLCSLRLTCKLFYQVTVHHFGRTCLQRVETDLSLNSLQRLAMISQHQQLRHHVHHITINANEVHRILFGRGFSWDRHPLGHLIFPQPGIQQLQDIRTLLANCSSFHICGANLWGEDLGSDCLGLTDVVAIILHIVSETGLPVRFFSVDFKATNQGEAIAMDARRLYMPDLQKTGFITAWSHLRELSLQQDVAPGAANYVTELIVNAPNLLKLTIDFDHNDATESIIHRLSSADSLPQLQQLELKCASIKREDQFLNFLRHFRHSLRTVYLSFIGLNVGGWRPVLASLSNDFTSLESIRLMVIKNMGGRIVHFPALLSNPFVNESNGRRFIFSIKKRLYGGDRVIWVSYTGPNMGMALQTLIRHGENI